MILCFFLLNNSFNKFLTKIFSLIKQSKYYLKLYYIPFSRPKKQIVKLRLVNGFIYFRLLFLMTFDSVERMFVKWCDEPFDVNSRCGFELQSNSLKRS